MTSTDRENLLLFDAASGRLVRSWGGHGATVRAVAFSPDGTRPHQAAGRRPDNVNEGEVDTSVCGWSVPEGAGFGTSWVGLAAGSLRTWRFRRTGRRSSPARSVVP